MVYSLFCCVCMISVNACVKRIVNRVVVLKNSIILLYSLVVVVVFFLLWNSRILELWNCDCENPDDTPKPSSDLSKF